MPLQGEYAPSPAKWVREQVKEYGASSGKLRKNPVMRVEHDGVYAAVASKSGSPEHPSWYRNIIEHPRVA